MKSKAWMRDKLQFLEKLQAISPIFRAMYKLLEEILEE
jgi:hypothetical protein